MSAMSSKVKKIINMQNQKVADQLHKKRKQYDSISMMSAYNKVKNDGISVYRAARNFGVPESTLRDRIMGLVGTESLPGPKRLFSDEEENKLSEHIKYMASIGYGYSKQEVINLATDLAEFEGKRNKENNAPLSSMWFYSFIKKHTDLQLLKPRKLNIARAECASADKVRKYYKELSTIMTTNGLHNKPHLIFNVDETGNSTEHNPPKILCQKNSNVQAITSPRSSNVTIIGCGNAAGNFIPPYYIFPGKRWNNDFLEGSPPGSSGECTESGWSNMSTFQNFLENHFLQYVNRPNPTEPILLLYDGHKSHISLFLTEWAKKNNVILFILPPHTSHLLQPLDVGIFGPFKTLYNKECQKYLRENPGARVTKHQMGKLTRSPYLSAFSPQNLIAAFRKCGVFPCQNTITDVQVAPASLYKKPTEDNCQDRMANDIIAENEHEPDIDEENSQPESISLLENNIRVDEQVSALSDESMLVNEPEIEESTICKKPKKLSDFFESRKITSVQSKSSKLVKPKRKPYSIVGNLAKKTNQDALKAQKTKQNVKKFTTPWASSAKVVSKTSKQQSEKLPVKKNTNKVNKKSTKKKVSLSNASKQDSQKAGTSGIGQAGGPFLLDSDMSYDDEDEVEYKDEEKCCVCKCFEPKQLKDCYAFVITKWAQCDIGTCKHWVHLIYCTPTRVIRLGDVFKCPCCQ